MQLDDHRQLRKKPDRRSDDAEQLLTDSRTGSAHVEWSTAKESRSTSCLEGLANELHEFRWHGWLSQREDNVQEAISKAIGDLARRTELLYEAKGKLFDESSGCN